MPLRGCRPAGWDIMKRPLAVIGFTYLFTLIAASCLNFMADAALAGLFLIFAVITLLVFRSLKHIREIAAILISAALAMAAYCGVTLLWYEPAAQLSAQQAEVRGKIAELPTQSGDHWYYIVKPDQVTVSGKNTGLQSKIRLKTDQKLNAQPFDTITFKALLSTPSQGVSGGFDSRAYYRSKGIYLFAKALDTPRVTPAKTRPPYYYAIVLRQYISDTINKYTGGDRGALAAGILIGDVSKLPDSIKSDFTLTGISHILAVSGTQTSLIMEYMMLVLCALRLRKRPAALCTAAAVVLFMAVTGFSPSVMRAGIMALIFLAAIIIRREADALNSLGLSVLLMCLANPFAATDVGLLLSFTATLGMITVSKKLYHSVSFLAKKAPDRAKHLLKGPAGLLCETVGASLLTYPVIILTFGQVSGVTLFSNMIEVPVSLFVTLAAAVMVMLEPLRIFTILIKPIAMLIRVTTAFMAWYAHQLASLPFASVSTGYGFVLIVLIFTLLSALLYIVFKGRGASLKICAVCICFTLTVGILSYTVSAQGVMTIAALPVEGGNCTVILCGGHAVIYDLDGSGAAYQAGSFLKSHDVRQVDALILPVYDKNRVKYANELMDSVPVDKIYIPGAYQSDENPAAECITGPAMIKWSGISLVMIPDKTGASMLGLMDYGSYSAVLTGGADADLAKYGVAAQSLRAGMVFFSGGISKDFAKAVASQLAIEGGSGGAYGGAVLESAGCKVHDTNAEGAVLILARQNGNYIIKNQS